MTAAVMTFLVLVSMAAAVASRLAEGGLRGFGLPTRFVWLAGLMVGPTLLAARALAPAVTPSMGAGALPEVVVELPALIVGGAEPAGRVLDLALLGFWIVSFLAVVTTLGVARLRLARDLRQWTRTRVLGVHVSVSRDLGPAVVGITRSAIVLPEWILHLPEPQLGLVLAHEEEHRSARDPALLAAAVALVAATAWNPVSWWMLRRLRHAIEIDCDRRVLRSTGSRRAYGESLLTVAGRACRPTLPMAAFTEAPHALERRLLAMTTRISNRTRLAGSALMAVAALVGAQACSVDSPLGRESADEEPVRSQVVDLSEPTFTPFTDAPTITNRDEVIAALGAEYPALLRDAGVGGTVRIYFFIDETGTVGELRLDQSSGHQALDQAALRVAGVYRFTPALNRGDAVPVWVSFPITFRSDAG